MAKVYELPAEPPFGTPVVDRHQLTWRRDENEDYGALWRETTSGMTSRWYKLLAHCGPLTEQDRKSRHVSQHITAADADLLRGEPEPLVILVDGIVIEEAADG